MDASRPSPLQFLGPQWFAIVMGWSGLGLAWLSAQPLLGPSTRWVSIACASIAAVSFVVVLLGSLIRLWRFRSALVEDLNHPVRHAFAAAFPVSILLLSTLFGNLGVAPALLAPVWLVAAATQLLVTVWVMTRWIIPGLRWAAVTPVVFIPVVGNVVVPLGAPLFGYVGLGWFFLGVGAFCWPIVLTLLFVRTAQAELPARLIPTWFISIAPPAVVGLGCLNLARSADLAMAAFGIGCFFLALSMSLARGLRVLAFGMPFWAISFPLAALAALALALVQAGGLPISIAVGLLALASAALIGLSIATIKGLLAGTLLVAEPAPPSAAVVQRAGG